MTNTLSENNDGRSSISVVVPVYNEEKNIAPLYQEIKAVLIKIGKPCEIIFVNDGSTDDTLQELKKLKPAKIINFRKNFGQTAALDAGIKAAAGDIIVTIDGDGQNDPDSIPLLLEKINEGYDVVCGWRWKRKDRPMKKFLSRGANFLRRVLVSDRVQDSGCTLRAFRRYCFDDIDLHGELHRFIPAILSWKGFTISEVKVNHRQRLSGKTKYSWKRVPKGFLDLLGVWFWRKYANRPLHLFGGIGLLFSLSGFLSLAVILTLRLFGVISLAERIFPLLAVFLILMGIQLFVTGILADIAVKNYYKIAKQQPYKIKEIINNSEK